MANPFDISAFNLLQFAEMVNNLYDDTPMQLEVPVKQPDGSITYKNIQNLGQFKQRIWDTINANMQFSVVKFYVDPINGADTNDGLSANTAFRTVKKAVDSIQKGGAGYILLTQAGYTYEINENIDISQKAVYLYESVYGQKYNLQFNTYLPASSIKRIGQFRVEGGGIGFIKIHGCENITLNDNYPDVDLVYTTCNIFETTNAGAGANIIVALNVNNIYNNVSGAGIIGGYTGHMQINLMLNNFYLQNDNYFIRSDYKAMFEVVGSASFYKNNTAVALKDTIRGLIVDANGNPKNLITTI